MGRWGALGESLQSGWGSGWGCVVGGLTRGRSWGGDSCGRFDQGLGEGVEGVQALKELSDSGCVD